MKVSNVSKQFIVCVCVALALTHCGGNKSDSDSNHPTTEPNFAVDENIFGSWKGEDAPIYDDFKNVVGRMETILTIGKDSVSSGTSCRFHNRFSWLEVSSSATIKSDHIVISEDQYISQSFEVDGFSRRCYASLKMGKFNYQLMGKTLFLKSTNDATLVLNKL